MHAVKVLKPKNVAMYVAVVIYAHPPRMYKWYLHDGKSMDLLRSGYSKIGMKEAMQNASKAATRTVLREAPALLKTIFE